MPGDLHREDQVRVALDALARVATETGAVVMFVRHFGKGGGNASDKMSGSHAFRDASRSVFLFAQDDDRVIVTQDKGNYAPPDQDSFAFRLEDTSIATDNGSANVARVIELGASDLSVGDIINRVPATAVDEDQRDHTDDPRASWLYAFLAAAGKANEAVRPKDAVAYAADKGISRRTVFRLFGKLANAGLAVSKDVDGFPRVTHWSVTADTTSPALWEGDTTGTTGDDLHKQGGTTGQLELTGGTAGGTVSEQGKRPDAAPVVPVVSPTASELGTGTAPGGITPSTPGNTDRVRAILANIAQAAARSCNVCGTELISSASHLHGACAECRLVAANEGRPARTERQGA